MMTAKVLETDCTVTHQGRAYTAGGAWLTERGGAVYVIRQPDGTYQAQTWNGQVLTTRVHVVSEWTRYGRSRGEPYRMRAVRMTIDGIRYSGVYGPDWAELCRIRRSASWI